MTNKFQNLNKETEETLKDSKEGKNLHHYNSTKEMFEDCWDDKVQDALNELKKELGRKYSNPEHQEDLYDKAQNLVDALENTKPVVDDKWDDSMHKTINIELKQKPYCKKHFKVLINDKVGCELCLYDKMQQEKAIKTSLIEWIDNQDINVDILTMRELLIKISEFLEFELVGFINEHE